MHSIYDNIPTLDEILRAHELGRVNVSRTDGYLIAKYSQQTTITKDWDHVTMCARGIVYDEMSGDVLFLPFRKFFNHGENELQSSSLPATGIRDAEILEKLDGSMGGIWRDRNGEIRVSTPGSIESDQAIWATQWLRSQQNYGQVREYFEKGIVHGLVGEIIYPGSRVVVDYDYSQVSGIHLTAAQLVTDGSVRYATHEELSDIGSNLGLTTCEIYDYESIGDIKSHLREVDDFEGFVLHWPSEGFRLKLKADEYIRLHRIVSRIHPNRISEAICSKESQSATTFGEILSVVRDCIDAFPEEHRPPYEEAYDMLSSELLEIEATVPPIVEEIARQNSAFVGPAFKKSCVRDIQNSSSGIEKKNEAYAFALLEGKTPILNKMALRSWKAIRKEIDWLGGDTETEE